MELPQLVTVLASTFDPNLRSEAEARLNEIFKMSGFAPTLLQVVMSNEVQLQVRQAGCIYLKNLVAQCWKERQPNEKGEVAFVIIDQDKQFIRDHIVEAIIQAPELIRIQLTVCVNQILKHDFPERWPGIVEKIHGYITSENRNTWLGSLMALYQIVKKYEFKKEDQQSVLHEALQVLLPILYSRCVMLLEDQSELSVAIQKQILKIFHNTIQYFLPLNLITEANFPGWVQVFLQIVDRPVPQLECEDDLERERLIWWKCKKWAVYILNKVIDRYGNPGAVNTEYAMFAKFYVRHFAVSVTNSMLKILDQYRRKEYVAPRVLQKALNYLKNGVGNSQHWKVMLPHMQGIVQEVVFPLMCHSEEDAELWEEDPYEFIRLNYNDIFEDLISPVVAASSLLYEASKKRKQILEKTMVFCVQVLNLPDNQRNPRQKDGALHMIGALSELILKRKAYQNQMENMIMTHVLPEFKSPHGFLRARACWVVKQMDKARYTSEGNFKVVVDNCIMCLTDDKDLPVKLEAAIALKNLIESQEKCQEYITPHIRQVLLELLNVIKETENDDLTEVVKTLIESYGENPDVLAIAVDIANNLAMTFMTLLDSEDPEDKAITAMGILTTVDTMLSYMNVSKEANLQLETIAANLAATCFKQSFYELYEEACEIIETCTQCEISPQMWQLLYLTYDTFQKDAFDYFRDMAQFLHQYITVDTPAFVGNPKHVEIMFNMCKKVLKDSEDEDDQSTAAKLLEVIILQCRGQIDQWIPLFLEASLERLTREVKTSEVRVMCLHVIVAAIYYNATLTLSTLDKMHLPNSEESVLRQFFTQWLDDSDCVFGLHDRKMYILGFSAIMDMPSNLRPGIISQFSAQIIPAMLLVFSGLERAYENKALMMTTEEEEEEEETDEEAADEEGLVSDDEDEIDDEGQEYLEYLAKKASDHLDDEDVDGETELEKFPTILEHEEINIDEYILFRQVFHKLQSADPQWYVQLTNTLNAEKQEQLKHIFTLAEQRQAAHDSKRIEQAGGYSFNNSFSIPNNFSFGGM